MDLGTLRSRPANCVASVGREGETSSNVLVLSNKPEPPVGWLRYLQIPTLAEGVSQTSVQVPRAHSIFSPSELRAHHFPALIVSFSMVC